MFNEEASIQLRTELWRFKSNTTIHMIVVPLREGKEL
jgi:hypothetical protein